MNADAANSTRPSTASEDPGPASPDLFAVIADAMTAGDPLGVSDPNREWPQDWCEQCGGDGDLVLMHAPQGGTVRVHEVCGDLCRCTPIPLCPGAPGACRAAAGRPCRPDCSARTRPPG